MNYSKNVNNRIIEFFYKLNHFLRNVSEYIYKKWWKCEFTHRRLFCTKAERIKKEKINNSDFPEIVLLFRLFRSAEY